MSSGVAEGCLSAEDATELGELLVFLGDWIVDASDILGDALTRFCGKACCIEELRVDLARFALLLGARPEQLTLEDDR